MAYGTIIEVDNHYGHGWIKPETGGVDLRFEKIEISWGIERGAPVPGERLSFEVGTNRNSQPCAVNIQPVSAPE